MIQNQALVMHDEKSQVQRIKAVREIKRYAIYNKKSTDNNRQISPLINRDEEIIKCNEHFIGRDEDRRSR